MRPGIAGASNARRVAASSRARLVATRSGSAIACAASPSRAYPPVPDATANASGSGVRSTTRSWTRSSGSVAASRSGTGACQPANQRRSRASCASGGSGRGAPGATAVQWNPPWLAARSVSVTYPKLCPTPSVCPAGGVSAGSFGARYPGMTARQAAQPALAGRDEGANRCRTAPSTPSAATTRSASHVVRPSATVGRSAPGWDASRGR